MADARQPNGDAYAGGKAAEEPYSRSLHDGMTAEGARLLSESLLAAGYLPPGHPVSDAELRRVCQDVQSEWLRGGIPSPLHADLVRIAYERLLAGRPDSNP